jgi:hypothetical protein
MAGFYETAREPDNVQGLGAGAAVVPASRGRGGGALLRPSRPVFLFTSSRRRSRGLFIVSNGPRCRSSFFLLRATADEHLPALLRARETFHLFWRANDLRNPIKDSSPTINSRHLLSYRHSLIYYPYRSLSNVST